MLIITIFVILAFEINVASKIMTVRKDLFYISQDCQIALNIKNLEYNEYVMDKSVMKKIVSTIITKNYDGKVTLKEIDYDSNNNEIKISVNLLIEPIIKINKRKEIIIPIEAKYKLKLLEVK